MADFEDEELVRQSGGTARKRSMGGGKKTVASKSKYPKTVMKKWPQHAYTELRQENIYDQPRSRHLTYSRFYTSMQEQIYLEVYRTFLHPISPQKYINLATMENNHVYFGQALQLCKKFGLLPQRQWCTTELSVPHHNCCTAA